MTKQLTYDDLKPEHQQFIDLYFEGGGTRKSAIDACKVIYGYDQLKAQHHSWRLLRNPKITAVLKQRTTQHFASLHVLAADQLAEIIATGLWHGQPVKASEGLKAIKEALERGVGPVVTKHEVEVNDNRSVNELKAHVTGMLARLSPEDKKLFAQKLGAAAVDADFEEVQEGVDPAAPWGRKKDGTPRDKPGVKKLHLPGPEAVRPGEAKAGVRELKARMKERLVEAAKRKAEDAQFARN